MFWKKKIMAKNERFWTRSPLVLLEKNKVKLGTDIDMKVMATFLNRMVIYYEKRI